MPRPWSQSPWLLGAHCLSSGRCEEPAAGYGEGMLIRRHRAAASQRPAASVLPQAALSSTPRKPRAPKKDAARRPTVLSTHAPAFASPPGSSSAATTAAPADGDVLALPEQRFASLAVVGSEDAYRRVWAHAATRSILSALNGAPVADRWWVLQSAQALIASSEPERVAVALRSLRLCWDDEGFLSKAGYEQLRMRQSRSDEHPTTRMLLGMFGTWWRASAASGATALADVFASEATATGGAFSEEEISSALQEWAGHSSGRCARGTTTRRRAS